MKHWYIFILMLLLPIETYSKGQRQNDFQTLVEKYQQKLATSITMLCAHNYDKDPFTIRLSKEQLDMIKDGYKARDLLNHFVGRGGRYNVSSIGVTTSAVVHQGPIITMKIINSSGSKKIIKKTAEKMYDYLYKEKNAIDKIKVDAIEAFKINEVKRNKWNETIVYSNKIERYETDSNEQLGFKTEKYSELTTVVGLPSTAFQLEINEYGYSLLLSDVEITVWIK